MTWGSWIRCSLAAGLMLFLVGVAFHCLIPIIAPGLPPQFLDGQLFRDWFGWTSTYMVIHPFVYGFVFAAVFAGLRQSSFPSGPRGGLLFGLGVFVVGSLPIYLLAFASFRVSGEIISSWIFQSLAQYTLAGLAVGCIADGMSFRVSTRLPAPADRVWELLLRKDTFLSITRGMLSYDNTERWPETLFAPGTTVAMRVRLFGRGPAFRHDVRVVRVNAAERLVETEEHGRLVSVWKHRMCVQELSDSESRYEDRIELQAGLLTPLVWLFANVFYRHRQRRWKELVARP